MPTFRGRIVLTAYCLVHCCKQREFTISSDTSCVEVVSLFQSGFNCGLLVGNALLQAAQVAVTLWHVSAAPAFVLLSIERFCFLPAPMHDVAIGEGKIGAVLVASTGKMIPSPII